MGGGRKGESLLNGHRVSIWNDEILVLVMVLTTLNVMPLNQKCLKMLNMANKKKNKRAKWS